MIIFSGADPNLRDYSGRKPIQYRNTANQNSSLKANSIRSEYFMQQESYKLSHKPKSQKIKWPTLILHRRVSRICHSE